MKLNSQLLPDLLFTVNDVARVLKISPASARVLCSRYAQLGQIIRLRNDLYILAERFSYITQLEYYRIANRIQIPSYISLSTALNYYELSEQIYRKRIESIARKRSIEYSVRDWQFKYCCIKPEYYQGFTLENGVFIAEAAKALADIIYFCSMGRYAFDFHALEWERLDRDKIERWLKLFPLQTQRWWEKHGFVAKT
jgi:predicted transcriptional regulator of viral defense system